MNRQKFHGIGFSLIVLILGLAGAGCQQTEPTAPSNPPSAPQPGPSGEKDATDAGSAGNDKSNGRPEPGDTSPPEFTGTAGITDKERPQALAVVLREVRTAQHEGFDRVVFEFAGALPGYHIEYIDRPVRQCGSGHTVELAGEGWLRVRLRPAYAHTTEGQPTVTARERRLKLPVLQELELTCDFEAEVTWVLGVGAPNRYRVLELAEPARLVIDIKH